MQDWKNTIFYIKPKVQAMPQYNSVVIALLQTEQKEP